MTIKLAIMRPARAQSGRRYFRGTDKTGSTYWLMEEPGSEGHRWILQMDASGSMIAPEDVMKLVTSAPSATEFKQLKDR